MERDTEEVFEELTRGLETEISERRRRELLRWRRSVPRIVAGTAVGTTATIVMGMVHPALGTVAFVVVVWLLERAVTRLRDWR